MNFKLDSEILWLGDWETYPAIGTIVKIHASPVHIVWGDEGGYVNVIPRSHSIWSNCELIA